MKSIGIDSEELSGIVVVAVAMSVTTVTRAMVAMLCASHRHASLRAKTAITTFRSASSSRRRDSCHACYASISLVLPEND